jgi:dihydroorotate dehydrogenase electron transfer subunit
MTFYACGPDGMLKAVGERAVRCASVAWLSLDKHMGCGVGACLACVQKIRLPDGEEVLERVCREGPVFEAREIVWP